MDSNQYDEDITLYKNLPNGGRRTWRIVREGNKYKTYAGLEGGSIRETKWTEVRGKISTTADEQASLDLHRKISKKNEGGFTLDGNPMDIPGVKTNWEEPTLALKYRDRKESVVYPVLTSPKLDGARCYITKDGMYTRTGREWLSSPHILKQLQPLFDQQPDLILDGELYNHTLNDDFEKIMSLIKKKKPTPADIAESARVVEFWCFDIESGFGADGKPFKDRYEIYRDILLERAGDGMIQKFPSIKAVRQYTVVDQAQLERSCKSFIKDRFEGGMIRNPEALYQHKRTADLLKFKLFIDEEFEVIDVEEGIGDRSGMVGRLICKTKTGEVFGASPNKKHPVMKEMWDNRQELIGQQATVKFQNYSKRGVPRIIIGATIRDYE
jgi:DNA ligase 1